MSKSQTDRILAHLRKGKSLTPIQALNKFNCFRLAARISELRAQGYNITNTHKPGKHARYLLARKEAA